MNFFENIAALELQGTIKMTVQHSDNNQFTVSVLLDNEQCGDKARKVIPPLILKGTAQELDAEFFASISTPIKTTSSLLLNMEAYLKAQEEAKKKSAIEKDKSDKEQKAQQEKDKSKTDAQKKFEATMKKADELEKEGKYREAWMKVPEPTAFPEFEETISERRKELAMQFEPDLFS